MAQRPFWQGYLRLSLVTRPVAMLPATSEAEKVRFHTLNRATGNRVQPPISMPRPASRSTTKTR
jgi:DNA end-binding protein Ku